MYGPKVMRITENSAVSFSLVGAIIGGVFWFTSLYMKVEANASDMTTTKIKQERNEALLLEIRDRVMRIESKIVRHNER